MKCTTKYTYIKTIKEETSPKWCCFNNHWYKYILLKDQESKEEAFIIGKIFSIEESLFNEISLSSSLRSPIDRCLKKLIRFLTLDLDFIMFSKLFYGNFCETVLQNILKTKVEIDFTFALTLVFFHLVTKGKQV